MFLHRQSALIERALAPSTGFSAACHLSFYYHLN